MKINDNIFLKYILQTKKIVCLSLGIGGVLMQPLEARVEYGNLAQGSLTEALKGIGVLELWDKNLTGKGIVIAIHDEFPSHNQNNDKRDYTHGEIVLNYAHSTAPDATLLPVDMRRGHPGDEDISDTKYLTPEFIAKHNVRIVNRSIGPTTQQLSDGNMAALRLDKLLEITKMGVVVLIGAGNNNALLGTEAYGKALLNIAQAVNEDPDNPGSIIIVGSGIPTFRGQDGSRQSAIRQLEHPILSNYTAMAGIVRDYYLYVPVSLTVERSSSNKFSRLTGTSYAAPTVTGMVALLMQAFPQATGKQIANLLLATAQAPQHLSTLVSKKLEQATNLSPVASANLFPADIYGRGEANVYKALERGKKNNFSAPEKLNTSHDSLIMSARYDIFADSFYRNLEFIQKTSKRPEWFINYLKQILPPSAYNFPIFYSDESQQVRPYAKMAFTLINQVIKEFRVDNPNKIDPIIPRMVMLYAEIYPNSLQVLQRLQREIEIARKDEDLDFSYQARNNLEELEELEELTRQYAKNSQYP